MIQRALAVFLIAIGSALVMSCQDQQQQPEVKPRVQVDVAAVMKRDLAQWVEVYGRVEGEPAASGRAGGAARLMAPATGLILAIPAREGERVSAGTVIARLDDRVAAANMARAARAVALAEEQSARQDRLLAIGSVSAKAAEDARQQVTVARAEAASAAALLAQVRLSTPVSGVVARIFVQPGQTVDPATVVASVVDDSRLQVAANLPSQAAGRVAAGQTAQILTTNADRPIAGQVAFVSPEVNPVNDSVLVRLAPKAPGLRIGQFVKARIRVHSFAGQIAVPREAVYTDHDGRSTVALVRDGHAFQTPVQVLVKDGAWVGVAGTGLDGGAVVVTRGAYALPDGVAITVQNKAAPAGQAR